ncbi:DNA polymerase IV [Amaricoccus solimangrovi]|uniref:DNA polymerase IV n=1 Tax=Amaricoccus solimangrovi TaxID=2589815 RepID=A0A501WHQ4_9RHOB|nr:DNA polymerase IV [Amaricoccus solimangrovi]TPE47965.1 DNA polymerase IV [Amaricoccus solimangrovi]
MDTPALCRDCLTPSAAEGRCPACGSPRRVRHPELMTLSTAHVDCDAFYASVEKRDDPAIRDLPVIIGGGRRGVVSTCCYIARIKGVRSAMPMFKALRLCPEAVVVPPRMAKYAEVSRAIRAMMLELTPLVEPLSLDEAFLDLTGTGRLHGAPPAVLLARLQARVEAELGITLSVGLSHNKFLAKIASDLDKPRGFAVIGRAETEAFLDPKPVGLIWGVGAAAVASLEREGIRRIGDLRRRERKYLIERFGALGDRLWHLARGEDSRAVSPDRAPKSISHETTFDTDIGDPAELRRHLWILSEELSARAKAKEIGGRTITLKLRRADFALLSRRHTLDAPTQLADRIFRAAEVPLIRDLSQGPFRLIGVGISELVPAERCDPADDLLDAGAGKRRQVERASDLIRSRFGANAIVLGRALR